METNRLNPNIVGVQKNRKASLNTFKKTSNSSFNDILEKKVANNKILGKKDNVVFSKHANLRLEQRNIKLTDEDIKNISNAVDKASEKNIKNSLIMMDDMALIANVKSRTIVTIVDSIKDKVFTNVDGVVSI